MIFMRSGARVASMRPPHECGGKRTASSRRAPAGARFNEAPARMRGKTRLEEKQVVWGKQLQ